MARRPLVQYAVLLPLAVVVAVATATVAAGCSDRDKLEYSEDRGLYSLDELRDPGEVGTVDGEVDAEAVLAEGDDLAQRGQLREAVLYFTQVAERYPRLLLALEARIRKVEILIQLEELDAAHHEMMRIVSIYKEYLQQTRRQQVWDALRFVWYDQIGLGLFFADKERTRLASNLDPAIRVFQQLLNEEFRGRYAALCLLRIGDAYMAKRQFAEARRTYLRVVEHYPDFQQYHEHEEALYKAAETTMGTMKGAEYNLERLNSRGSETTEKGALNLLNDYLRQYPEGRHIAEVRQLLSRIHEVLAWRDFNAAQVYDRMGRRDAARMQYYIVVQRWGGDKARLYPEQQTYVQRAQQRLNELGGPLSFEDENQPETTSARE